MINLFGTATGKSAFCDGLSRRAFIKVGGMAAGGLALPNLLKLEAASRSDSSPKSVINIFLPGGPSHLDMFDLKPDAPKEVRGEFKPIGTNVPGIQICELFPRLARMADKFTIIRSICDSEGLHDGYQCMTGRTRREAASAPAGGWPSFGAWISKVQGSQNGMPANVSMVYPTGHRFWGEPGDGGFIGVEHCPISLVDKDPNAKARDMSLGSMTLDRLADRESLRQAFDNFQRNADHTGQMRGIDSFHQQALSILSGGGLSQALDLSRESPAILDRYGVNDPRYQRDGAPKMIRNFLIARRLVEAGVRVVSLNYSRWDWHGGDGLNFPRSREEFPLLDQGLSALITDLYERGLHQDVSVVVWGEFGRTPRINNMNSRDHWPNTSFALMIGGGMKSGQVIGATDRIGGEVIARPVQFQEVFATLYHNLGIDLKSATVNDPQGRPHFLIDPGIQPIRELIG